MSRVVYSAVGSPAGPLEVLRSVDHCADGVGHVMHEVHVVGTDHDEWISAEFLTATAPGGRNA